NSIGVLIGMPGCASAAGPTRPTTDRSEVIAGRGSLSSRKKVMPKVGSVIAVCSSLRVGAPLPAAGWWYRLFDLRTSRFRLAGRWHLHVEAALGKAPQVRRPGWLGGMAYRPHVRSRRARARRPIN